MTKRKLLQHSLWLTALLATVFFFYAPILHIPLYRAIIFWLLVFLPQVVAIICQFREVHDRYREAFKKPEEKIFTPSHAKGEPNRRRAVICTSNSAAAIKRGGIHPNRAGPALAFV